jgi:hypothetical protein
MLQRIKTVLPDGGISGIMPIAAGENIPRYFSLKFLSRQLTRIIYICSKAVLYRLSAVIS